MLILYLDCIFAQHTHLVYIVNDIGYSEKGHIFYSHPSLRDSRHNVVWQLAVWRKLVKVGGISILVHVARSCLADVVGLRYTCLCIVWGSLFRGSHV